MCMVLNRIRREHNRRKSLLRGEQQAVGKGRASASIFNNRRVGAALALLSSPRVVVGDVGRGIP